ncbi:antibiotic biosynthesis monooxygenase family protein [candidate division KSB1 bacterium]
MNFEPEALTRIKQIYDDTVIPRLHTVPGCLCACVIINTIRDGEGMSLTLWNSREDAENYENSGVYNELLQEIQPYLTDSSDWKVQLSKDLKVEFRPVSDEPEITAYDSLVQSGKDVPPHDISDDLHVKIVTIKVQPEKLDEFRDIYSEKVIPALSMLKGCLYIYLTESSADEKEVLSVTIWNSKEAVDEYESSGFYNELIDKLKHTFAGLSQWKMALDDKETERSVTSEDVSVGYYKVVTGKSFR